MGTMVSCTKHTKTLSIHIESYDITKMDNTTIPVNNKKMNEFINTFQSLRGSPAVSIEENSEILPSMREIYHNSVNTTEDSDASDDSLYSCSYFSGECSCCCQLISESSNNHLAVLEIPTLSYSAPLFSTQRSLREEDQTEKLFPMNLPQSRTQAFQEIQEQPRPKMLPRSRSIFSSQAPVQLIDNVGSILQFIRLTNSCHLPNLLNV
jgi:hypothetical protein